MRPISCLSLLLALTAVAAGAAGCADPSHAREADDLRDDLAVLPGVTTVKLDYVEPVTLDSGKLVLTVGMDQGASPEELTAVAATAYDAFSTTHHDEEADLAIRAGRTTVALRSFEPEASASAVRDAVRTGLEEVPPGGAATIDLTTQEVARGDHVAGTYVITLPAGSTARDVPAFLDDLATRHPGDDPIGWGAAAADGSSLSYDDGFAPDPLVATWRRLQEGGVPMVVRAYADGGVFATGRLAQRLDVRDPGDRRTLEQIARTQIGALGEKDWVYELQGAGGAALVSVDRFTCDSTAEGDLDDDVEAWVTARLGRCSPS